MTKKQKDEFHEAKAVEAKVQKTEAVEKKQEPEDPKPQAAVQAENKE